MSKPKTLTEWFSDKNHWTQGKIGINLDGDRIFTPKGYKELSATCLAGGIFFIYSDSEVYSTLYVVTTIKSRLDGKYKNSITAFNDDPETTIEDIRKISKGL